MATRFAGLAVLGSRKKGSLCLKVDTALGEMLPDLPDGRSSKEGAAAVADAQKDARMVITVLISVYEFPKVRRATWYAVSGALFCAVIDQPRPAQPSKT